MKPRLGSTKCKAAQSPSEEEVISYAEVLHMASTHSIKQSFHNAGC